MLTVHSIINSLFKESDIKYLELGLSCGTHFNKLSIKNKESVDIATDPRPYGKPTYLMSTDDFFKQNNKKYDIVFIDADHDHKQVIKDFNNAIDVLNDDGVIFLHDLYPAILEQTKKIYCDDSFKILDYFMKNNYDIIVNTSDFGSACVFNPKKINPEDVLSDLSWQVFINDYKVDNKKIFGDLNSFTNLFKEKNKIKNG
jgi:hypothetical protein